MKSIIWKELRENVKWAALGWLVLTLAEIYAFGKSDPYRSNSSIPLFNPAYLLVSTYGCVLLGAALGIVQFLPELDRDRWAALLHLPAPRGSLFGGKILAGLGLYLLAALLPLASSIHYVTTPGRFAAPYLPAMVLPSLSDVLFGVAAYFGAILVCLHRGRWWGTRGAILLAFVPLFVMQTHAAGLWMFSVPLGSALLLALAARGAIQERSSFLCRGAFVLVSLTGSIAAALILSMVLKNLFLDRSKNNRSTRAFLVTKDGHVFISENKGDGSVGLTDLNGQPVTDDRYAGNNSYENTLYFQSFTYYPPKERPREERIPWLSCSRMATSYLQPIYSGYNEKESWFQLRKPLHLFGYDKITKLPIGFFDATGFHRPGSPIQPFPELIGPNYAYYEPHYYIFSQALYALNFTEQTMKMVYRGGSEKLQSVGLVSPNSEKPGLLVLGLDQTARIIEPDGTLVVDLQYPFDPVGFSVAVVTPEDQSRFFVQFTQYFWSSKVSHRPTYLMIYSHDGQILETHEIPPDLTPPPPPSLLDYARLALMPGGLTIFTTFVPQFIPPITSSYQNALTLPNINLANRQLIPAVIVLAVLSSLLTFVLVRRARFDSKAAWGWTLFSLLFGLPGLLCFLITVHWPIRVACQNCGSKRSIQAEQCPSCHQPWPSPPPTGTEIIDPADSPTILAS